MKPPLPIVRRPLPLLLLGLLLCADVTSYLFEKVACSHAGGDGSQLLANLLHQPLFWASLAIAPVQLLLWTAILGRIDLSLAYPISGLNMPLTLVAATIMLGEKLSWPVWLGAALITLGGIVLGPSGNEPHSPKAPLG